MSPSLTELQATLNSHWPAIGSIADLQAISQELGINSLNYRVQTSTGERYLLKTTAPEQALHHAQAVQVQAYCSGHGGAVPNILQPHSGQNHQWIVETPHYTASLQIYYPPHSEKSAVDQPGRVASELGKLHSILESYPHAILKKSGYEALTEEEIEAFQYSPTDFAADLLPKLPELQIKCSLPACLPKQVVHLDCHPGNVLLSENTEIFIVDFGHIILTQRILAVAFACHRFCGFDDQATSKFLQHYQDCSPLSKEEVGLLNISIAHEALRRIQFLLRSHFLQNDTRWDTELPRQQNILETALNYQQ